MTLPIGIRIAQLKQVHARVFEKVLRRHTSCAISGPQCNVLFHLWAQDGITISELSRRTQLTNATLTSMLDRLEAQQLLERRQNPENRREIYVFLTQHARELRQEYTSCYQEMTAINFKGFTPRERRQFEQYLERFYQNLTGFEAEQNIDGR